MNYNYVASIKDRTATILIYREIGGDGGMSGELIANDIYNLQDNIDVDNIAIRINSIGGNVLEGFKAFNSILSSKKPTRTYNDGVALSTAGWLFLAGNERLMWDYSIFMLHNPVLSSENEADNQMLTTVKTSIKNIISSGCNLSSNKIEKMMQEETWMYADECKNTGMCDEVLPTLKNKLRIGSTTAVNMWKIANKYIEKKIKTPINKMERITALLNLTNEASQESIFSAIVNLQKANKESIDALFASKATVEVNIKTIADLTNELTQLQKLETERALLFKTEKATELINSAIALGKITNEQKDSWLTIAISDIENAKAALDGIGINVKSINIGVVQNSSHSKTARNYMGEINERTKLKN